MALGHYKYLMKMHVAWELRNYYSCVVSNRRAIMYILTSTTPFVVATSGGHISNDDNRDDLYLGCFVVMTSGSHIGFEYDNCDLTSR